MITLILQVSVLMNGLGMRRLVGRFTCGLNSSHNYSEILATSRALKHPCTLLKINLNLSSCQVCKWLPVVQLKYSVPPVQRIGSGYTVQWSAAHAGWGERRGKPRAQSLPHFPVIHLAVLTSEVLRCSFCCILGFVVLTSHLPHVVQGGDKKWGKL